MSHHEGELPSSSSSFPISSPSFWDAAAQTATLVSSPPPLASDGTSKRRRTGSNSPPIPASYALTEVPKIEDANEEEEEKPLRAIGADETQPFKRPRRGSHETNLAYLPNRKDIGQNDPHGYLAGAEYAPNRFGDIGDYMRKKEIKIQTQNRDIALAAAAGLDLPQIFAGQSFHINGNTHPPMEELRKMILQRGGEVRPVLRSKGMVKFIIAPMLTQMKFKQFQAYKVVKEGWIVESCKAGKMLDWTRWKLTPQGGWEEGGRKGLEGFLAGRPTQTVKKDDHTDDDEMPEEAEETIEERRDEDQEYIESKPDALKDPPLPPDEMPKTPTKPAASAATQSLLTPVRASIPQIPISPGVVRAENPAKEPPTPKKVHKPEGIWEHYYSKESNEDAARLMKNHEWRLKNTAERGNEGGFIDGYYQNSRLHHLSTWKAELKVLVAAAQRQSEELSLAEPSTTSVSSLSLASHKLPPKAMPNMAAASGGTADTTKVIFHVDFDCFFVSCGLATRPHLKGKPTVVCHSQVGKGASSTSEIASCSYEARAKGVKNGMSLGRARTLAGDDLQTIPYEFETYKKFSLAFYTVLMGYADELQAVSVDEALIDVTSAVSARALAPEEAIEAGAEDDTTDGATVAGLPRNAAVEVAEMIRDDVRRLTEGCEVSIGIAHNILLAKLATRRAKPAGVFHLREPDVPAFLAPLDVEDFPSVGYSIKSKIEEKFGSTVAGSLLDVTKPALQKVLGPKTGEMVFGYLRGVDDRKLEPHKERKSISAEMNYGIRFQNQEQAEICVYDLAAEVSKRMKQVAAKGKLLTLKLLKRHPDAPVEPPKFLGHGWCETFNRSATIANKGGSATDDPAILGTEAVKLLKAMKLDPVELRGVGIQITKLDGATGDRSGSSNEREAGQGTLSFGIKRRRSETVKMEDDVKTAAAAPKINPTFKPEEATAAARSRQSREGSNGIDMGKMVRSPARALSMPPSTPPASPPAPPPGEAEVRSAAVNALAGQSSRIPTSSDGIDPEFLAALPDDLRQEVKRDFQRGRQLARSRAAPPPQAVVPSVAAPTVVRQSSRDQPAPSTSKSASVGRHEAAHITRQLRPKLKTQLKASAIAELPLYGAWSRASRSDAAVVDLSIEGEDEPSPSKGKGRSSRLDSAAEEAAEAIGKYEVSELKELGIDPEVFRELPADMQQEVVDAERGSSRKRQILHRPADQSRLRAKERAAHQGRNGRTVSLSPTRSARGHSAGPPAAHQGGPRLAIARPAKPALLRATALPDVLETITKWVESRKGAGPAARDANKVKAYLVKCMQPESALGGIESAVAALQWMRVVLEDGWGKRDEFIDDNDIHDGDAADGKLDFDGGGPGKQWWSTWDDFRREMQKISLNNYGAPLRL